ncbi:carbohydrate-binding protein [Agaribacterium haliotis]|uniref:carbohydrate-binding protein n=1 Tax=Agaribacterium haliotis TaxID=2013869 RepID=UPI000BB54AD1|nr:carbohydrate-binding protein [Agaribacterium haliotis]
MNTRLLCSAIALSLSSASFAYDWDGLPVPADAGAGQKWELHSLSDDFNYDAPAVGKSTTFNQRWKEGFVNAWTGPGLTEWHPYYSSMSDGKLNIVAGRKEGTNQVYAGSITSHEALTYPLYVEIRAKISDLVLASDAWLLSADSTQEIDILEAYGSSRPGQEWFAQRIHLSHHVFVREPFQDYQPSDNDEFSYGGDKDLTWYADGKGTVWRDDWHTIGVHWIDPWNLEYYIDGELVRITRPEEIDPRGYTSGTGLNKPMHLIFNTEDQNWRSDAGITPSDAELANPAQNTYYVDWVRIYKPVSDNSGGTPSPSPSASPSPAPGTSVTTEMAHFINTGKQGSAISGDDFIGFNANGIDNINYNTVGDWADYSVSLSEDGEYAIELVTASPINGGIGAEVSINDIYIASAELSNTGGWESYQSHRLDNTVTLSAGTHSVRVQSAGSSAWQWNGDEIRFIKVGDAAPAPSPSPSASPEPSPSPSTPPVGPGVEIVVEAESYTAMSGLDTQTWWGTTSFLGNNQTGDWAEFEVEFPATGSYTLSAFASTNENDGDANMAVYIDGQLVAQSPILGSSWNEFNETSVGSGLNISAGKHTVRVESTGSTYIWQWYLDKLSFSSN